MLIKALPEAFITRLAEIIPKRLLPKVLETFSEKRENAYRTNSLKQEGEEGYRYTQGRSSQLVSVVLDPQEQEDILDLCAAPGSKTSHIAAIMKNTGKIVAVESVRNRMYKLKSVLNLLGVTNTNCYLGDGRRFQSQFLFDRILVDAPCSSEGRFLTSRPKTYAYWSLRKIREMRRKQRGLLRHAVTLLKPGGVLVYATCTFAPEENEGVVDWLLRRKNMSLTVEPFTVDAPVYPTLKAWGEKTFDERVRYARRILPTDEFEGFFIAKFRKVERNV